MSLQEMAVWLFALVCFGIAVAILADYYIRGD